MTAPVPHVVSAPRRTVCFVVAAVLAVLVGDLLQVDGISILYPPAVVFFAAAVVGRWPLILAVGVATVVTAWATDPAGNGLAAEVAIRVPGLLAHWAAVRSRRRPSFRAAPMQAVSWMWGVWTVGSVLAATATLAVALALTSAPLSALWAPWQRLFLTHMAALFAMGTLAMPVAHGVAGLRGPRHGWLHTAAASGAVVLALLALAAQVPALGLVVLGCLPLLLRHVSDTQVGVVPVAAGVTAVLMAGAVEPGELQMAQAGMVAIGVLATTVHAMGRINRTQQAALAQREAYLRGVLSAVDEGVIVIGRARRILTLNAEAAAIFRLPGEEVVGQTPEANHVEWVDVDARPIAIEDLPSSRGLRGERVTDLRIGARHVDGVIVWCRVSTRPVTDGAGDPAVVITVRDVTAEVADERRRNAEESVLRHQALHDPLTGLANRQAFMTELDGVLPVEGRTHGLCYLDLDGFKSVNDDLGHKAGDEVLVQVAVRLRGVARAEDLVVRLGGDEFVVMCRDLPTDRAAEVMADLAAHAEEVTAEPVVTSAGVVTVGASTGWALVERDDPMAVAALDRADRRMLTVKRGRPDRVGRRGPLPADAGQVRTAAAAPTVYVVDDNPAMRLLAVRIAEAESLTVVGEAADGATAIEEILRTRPDVVVCDVMMPDVDGVQVVRAVRAVHPEQSFIFWSAMGAPALRRQQLDLGVACITKDRTEDLTQAIRQAATP